MSVPLHESRPSLLIVLIAGIGDLVLASHSLRAMRNGHPNADIHLLTSTDAAPLASNYPYIDYAHAFPIREIRKNGRYLVDALRVIQDLRKIRFDMLLNLYRVSSFSGAAKMGILFSLFHAGAKIGHDKHSFGLFLTGKVPAETFEDRHIVQAMAEIAARSGGIPDDKGIEVFWSAEVSSRWNSFFTQTRGKALIGINPGGDRENRRWDPERFAIIAAKIMERLNARIIIIGGPTDMHAASTIESRLPVDVTNLAGKTSVDELAYIVSRLDLLITNDSGPMHIAAATKTPLVALFGPENPRLFAPYAAPELYRVIHKDVSCRPCAVKRCNHPLCLDRISPEEVVKACFELLPLKLIKDS